jgi:hypothetical protein
MYAIYINFGLILIVPELIFFVKKIKLNRNSIEITENISITFQLFLSLIVKFQFIKKVNFSEF